MANRGINHLDLANDVSSVDGDETQSNAAESSCYDTESRKGTGETEETEANGLDHEDDGQTLPSETVEVRLSFGDLLLLKICKGARGLVVGVVDLSNLVIIKTVVLFHG